MGTTYLLQIVFWTTFTTKRNQIVLLKEPRKASSIWRYNSFFVKFQINQIMINNTVHTKGKKKKKKQSSSYIN